MDGQRIQHFRDLDVYRKAFRLAMEVFEATKRFPQEERYALVDQIRRSSRSVCANLAEGWRKRKYNKLFFQNKLTDAMQEASETQSWLEFSYACNYIAAEQFADFDKECERIIATLNAMEKNAEKFCF